MRLKKTNTLTPSEHIKHNNSTILCNKNHVMIDSIKIHLISVRF